MYVLNETSRSFDEFINFNTLYTSKIFKWLKYSYVFLNY